SCEGRRPFVPPCPRGRSPSSRRLPPPAHYGNAESLRAAGEYSAPRGWPLRAGRPSGDPARPRRRTPSAKAGYWSSTARAGPGRELQRQPPEALRGAGTSVSNAAQESFDRGHALAHPPVVWACCPFGWYAPGTARMLMATRFQALMAAAAQVRSTSSFSENSFLAFA